MTPGPVQVVAVTVTYNGATVLGPFLESALRQRGVVFHLVIIDNASSDPTRVMLEAINDCRVTTIFNDTNTGVAAANNQGIAWALDHGAARVLLINNDTEFDDALFARLDTRLSELGVQALTPLIPFYAEPAFAWYAGGSFKKLRGMISFHDDYRRRIEILPTEARRVDYAPTCCLMVDSSVFAKIGTMDEQYFVYWDDSDFCWRMGLAGLAIWYDPHLRLLHKVSSSTGGSESDFSIKYTHRNQMYFIRKFHNNYWLFYAIVIMFLKISLRLILGKDPLDKVIKRFAAMRVGLAMPIVTDLLDQNSKRTIA